MAINRRHFIKQTIAGSAVVLAASQVRAAEPALDPVAVVPLGKLLKTSRIGFGTGMRGGNRQSNLTRMGEEKALEILRFAYDQGVRYFDAADLYGTHQFVGKALKDKPRDSYQVGSKIWWRAKGIPETERPDADVVVKRFLQETQLEYLDVVQLHCVMEPDWNVKLKKQMDILSELKQKGVIKAHGVSCHHLTSLEVAAEEKWVDVVHARINPEGVKMDAVADKVVPVLKKMHENGKGIIGMKVIGEGTFSNDSDRIDRSVQFVTGLGTVDCMIVGFDTKEQITNFKERVTKALAAQAKK